MLLEFGIEISKGDNNLIKTIPFILEDAENNLPYNFRDLLASQKLALDDLIVQIKSLDAQIAKQHSTGGKERIGHIAKNHSDKNSEVSYLRGLFQLYQ
ncbi:hypothetical protein C0W35_21015 [Photobacterium kishitanii]|uniref:hypothetical protein n=1 Tax=Photobacterium kishitanii TaxID=318456 RepID=UPI000D1721EA|nr:hypothetical protein [Photobacterium kishitanii]PSU87907.1 hypothetical protein C0W35_21015 [Photobacterium kishitanii]